MNKHFAIAGVALLTLFGCAQDNTAPDNPQIDENNSVENMQSSREQESNVMIEKMDELPFQKFEFDINYEGGFDFEVELERNPRGNIDAEYRDESKNIDARGKEAFDLLYSKLKNLEINEDSTKEQAISTVLETFDLRDDYTELEIDIVFNDGTKREYSVND